MVFDFNSLIGKKVLLLTHENADLDTICSSAIFQRILLKKRINSSIGVPTHINESASFFASKEKITITKDPKLSDFNVILLFDCNSLDQLGTLSESFEKLSKKVLVTAFDHHIVKENSIDSSKEFIQAGFSTTQVLLHLFKTEFDKKCFLYAAVGILEDTGHFSVGNKELFDDFSFCLDNSGKDYADLLSFTKNSIPHDEKIALLKAAERVMIHEINKTIIATSTLSFYQSQAATKLLYFGADVALVSGFEEKNNISVLSCRADSVFKERTGFNIVNDLLKPLQERIGGQFGGHSGAAQWKGNYDHLKVLDECLFILKQKLS